MPRSSGTKVRSGPVWAELGPTVHARNVREKVLFPYINDHVLTYFYSFLQEKCKIEKGLF